MLLACSRSRNLVLCLAVLLCLALPARRAGAQGHTVHISWYKSPLADQLQLLANTYAQEHPGIEIAIDEMPQSQWYSNDFDQFAHHKTNFAAMVMASQWLGEAVTKGYVRAVPGGQSLFCPPSSGNRRHALELRRQSSNRRTDDLLHRPQRPTDPQSCGTRGAVATDP